MGGSKQTLLALCQWVCVGKGDEPTAVLSLPHDMHRQILCSEEVAGHGGTPICDQHRKGMGRLGIFLPRPSPCCTLFVPQEVRHGDTRLCP